MGTFFTHMGQTVRNVVFTFNLDPLVKVFGEPIRHHLSVAVVPIERRTDYFHMKYLGGKSVIVPAGTSLMPFPADIEAAAKRKAEWAFLPIIGPQTDIHFDIELVPHDHNARLTLDVQLHLKPGQANSPEFVPRVVPRS